MNVLVLFLSTLLLKLICRVVFFITFFLPVPVTVWPAFPDVKVRDREEIQHGLDVLLVCCCVIFQEVTARAVDNAKSQYVRHALHCAFGSTSTISHSSVFQAALIASCDSLLKRLNGRCCWRSLWSDCRWGWFSIFWIKLWTLTPCDRFTIEFGTPGMLKSMFSSSVAMLNLFALDDAVPRCSAGTNCSFTRILCCAWGRFSEIVNLTMHGSKD